MAERRRWGRAGVQLAQEQVTRSAWRAERRQEIDEEAHQKWAAGLVVPHRITAALDLCKLYGPEVDEACGAHEPDVDRWEAGELYPAWDQLVALARLTNFPLRFFVTPYEGPLASDTSLRFHCKPEDMPPPPVLAFKEGARDEMVQGRLW